MHKKRKIMKLISLFVSVVFVFSFALSCGGGGSSSGTPLSSTEKAAASSSAAMGAVQLSATIGSSADLAAGSIPAGYAPGKGTATDTSAIGAIDPRLKNVVDKMVAELHKPVIQNTMSKARSFKTMGAPLSSPTTTSGGCSINGTYNITFDSVVTGTTTSTTTDSINVTFTNCQDFDASTGTYSQLSGSMTGTHIFDTAGNDSANLSVNLTDKDYADNAFTPGTETDIFALNGAFTSVDNNGLSGNSAALGSFTWTMPGIMTLTFSFGSGTPVTDTWTDTAPGSVGTVTHTGNGAFTLAMTAPGQSVTLSVTLSSLVDAITTSTFGDTDESIDGTVRINWSPDLSQWGCLNGNYVFKTLAAIHTPLYSPCPTAGTLQVNNAMIQFGDGLGGIEVTVTVTGNNGSVSQIFANCDSLGQGMCK